MESQNDYKVTDEQKKEGNLAMEQTANDKAFLVVHLKGIRYKTTAVIFFLVIFLVRNLSCFIMD